MTSLYDRSSPFAHRGFLVVYFATAKARTREVRGVIVLTDYNAGE